MSTTVTVKGHTPHANSSAGGWTHPLKRSDLAQPVGLKAARCRESTQTAIIIIRLSYPLIQANNSILTINSKGQKLLQTSHRHSRLPGAAMRSNGGEGGRRRNIGYSAQRWAAAPTTVPPVTAPGQTGGRHWYLQGGGVH